MISYRKLKKKRDIEINDYLEYIIGIDLSFQSKERWTIKDKEELFVSSMEDDILSPHIIVNLKSSAQMAEKPSSKKLYKRHMDKGLEYLNIDSNNRTITYIHPVNIVKSNSASLYGDADATGENIPSNSFHLWIGTESPWTGLIGNIDYSGPGGTWWSRTWNSGTTSQQNDRDANLFNLTCVAYSMVVKINGSSDRAMINGFIDNMPARDARHLRTEYAKAVPNVELRADFDCGNCGYSAEMEVPLNAGFFWPDA